MIKPLNNYVHLELFEQPESNSRILLSEYSETEMRWGKVLNTGPGLPNLNGDLEPSMLAKDDLVYVMAHGRELIPLDDLGEESCCIASELDIMCIMENIETKQIQPLGTWIQVEKIEPEESAILIVDSKKTPTSRGRVVKLGKGWTDYVGRPIQFQVKEGDIILFNPFSPAVVDLSALGHDENLYLVLHTDLYAVDEPEEETNV
jgi:co-chaperonin GroES (HSP10)